MTKYKWVMFKLGNKDNSSLSRISFHFIVNQWQRREFSTRQRTKCALSSLCLHSNKKNISDFFFLLFLCSIHLTTHHQLFVCILTTCLNWTMNCCCCVKIFIRNSEEKYPLFSSTRHICDDCDEIWSFFCHLNNCAKCQGDLKIALSWETINRFLIMSDYSENFELTSFATQIYDSICLLVDRSVVYVITTFIFFLHRLFVQFHLLGQFFMHFKWGRQVDCKLHSTAFEHRREKKCSENLQSFILFMCEVSK